MGEEGVPDILNSAFLPGDTDFGWTVPVCLRDAVAADTIVLSRRLEEVGHRMQLQKMLQACKLESGQYALLEFDNGFMKYTRDEVGSGSECDRLPVWKQLRQTFQCRNVLLLGVEVSEIGLPIQLMPHQLNRFDGCSFIPSLTVGELEKNPDIKKHLWNYGLKPVYIDQVYG